MNFKILLKAIKDEDINQLQIIIMSLPFIAFIFYSMFEYIWLLIICFLFFVLAVILLKIIVKNVREKYKIMFVSPENQKYLNDGNYTFKIGAAHELTVQKMTIKNGKKEGEVFIYNDQNELIRKEIYENGKLIGDIVEFHNNGNKRMVYDLDELVYEFYNVSGNKIFSVYNIEDIEKSEWSVFNKNQQLIEKIFVNGKKAERFKINDKNEKLNDGVFDWEFVPGRKNAKYDQQKYVSRLVKKGVSETTGWMGPPGAPGFSSRFYDIDAVENLNDLLILK